MGKKLYKVDFTAYVVAGDSNEAEEIARDISLTIEDNSVKASKIELMLTNNIISGCEKFIKSMFEIPGMNSDLAQDKLLVFLGAMGVENLTKKKLDAIYSHCERIMIYEEEE